MDFCRNTIDRMINRRVENALTHGHVLPSDGTERSDAADHDCPFPLRPVWSVLETVNEQTAIRKIRKSTFPNWQRLQTGSSDISIAAVYGLTRYEFQMGGPMNNASVPFIFTFKFQSGFRHLIFCVGSTVLPVSGRCRALHGNNEYMYLDV